MALTPQQRTISAGSRREIERQESAEAFPIFVTITHESIDEPICIVSDPKDFTLNGNTYKGFVFDLDIPNDNERPPEARLTFQNVDRRIGDAVRNLNSPPVVKIEVYPLSDFDTTVNPRVPVTTAVAEYTADKLFLVDIEVDQLSISGRLVSWNYTQESFPMQRATQVRTPGLFV